MRRGAENHPHHWVSWRLKIEPGMSHGGRWAEPSPARDGEESLVLGTSLALFGYAALNRCVF